MLRRRSASVFGFVLALGALSGAGCSAIVSPDTSRFGPGSGVDGGGDPPRNDGAVDPEDDAGTLPGDDAAVTEDGGPTPIDGGPTCTGEPRCEGATLTRCEGGVPVVTTCPIACASDGARCGDFVPSNVGADLWLGAATDATINGMTTFDTSTCTSVMATALVVTQAGGPDVCVLQVRNLTVNEGAMLRVAGSRPLIVMATGDVDIRGAIDVGARLDQPGPGGGIGGRRGEPNGLGARGGVAGQRVGTFEDGGGAGGGFCGAGGAGGTGASAMGGGASARVDVAMLSPLRGGSGGGIGPGGVPIAGGGVGNIGLGGAGGGAVQISAQGRIRVSGAIVGSGGGGRGGGSSNTYTNFGAGGGGGSGGGILIEAPEVLFEGGVLGASGGGGGGGASNDDGGDGEDGRMVLSADGGESGGSQYGSTGGGSGGGAMSDAEPGMSNTGSSGNGGGGGGGAGCIVIRNASGSLPAGTTSGWSPSADGVLITRVRTL